MDNNYPYNNSENSWRSAPQKSGGYNQNPYGQNSYNQDPYGQNGYNQNPYGQKGYNQNPYGQNGYNQNPYGQNGYGQNPYGQNAYNQNQYGQNSYNQDPYGQNSYNQDPYDQNYYPQDAGASVDGDTVQPFRPNRTLLSLVTVIAAILEVLLIGAFAVVWMLTPKTVETADDETETVTQSAEEEAADGETADGETADGETADGEAADGESADEDGSSAAALALPDGAGTTADFEHSVTDTESGIVRGYDADGNEVWTYESGSYAAPDYDAWEYDSLVGLGEYNGLYYLCEDGDVIALYITDGSEAWRAEDCVGFAKDIAFDDDGNIYITSYNRPDLTILSQQGEVLAVEDELNPQAIHPDGIEVSDGTISVHFTDGLMDFAGGGGTVSVSVSDYIN